METPLETIQSNPLLKQHELQQVAQVSVQLLFGASLSKDGDSTASPGYPFQCLIPLTEVFSLCSDRIIDLITTLILRQPRRLLTFFPQQEHIAGSCSDWCSPGSPHFFLQSYFPDSLSAVCSLFEGVPLCHIIQANNKDANPYWLKVNFTVSDDYRKESTRQCEQVNDWTEQNIKFNEF